MFLIKLAQNWLKKLPNWLIFLVIGTLWSLLIVTPDFFPSTGIFISTLLLAAIIWRVKHHDWLLYDLLWLQVVLFLSLFLVLRSNPLLTFFNTIGLIYALSFYSLPPPLPVTSKRGLLFITLLAPLEILIHGLHTKNKYPYRWKKSLKIAVILWQKQKKIWDFLRQPGLLPGVIISIVFLIILLPILSSVNPIFADYINVFIDFFSPWNLILSFFDLMAWFMSLSTILRFWFIVWCLFWLPHYFSLLKDLSLKSTNHKSEISEKSTAQIPNLTWTLPKAIVGLLLLIFFVSQFQLYFWAQDLGYSQSEQVNEIFAQLSIVSALVFLLIYFDDFQTKFQRISSITLIAQGLFLLLMALISDLQYIEGYGLTFRRLYGMAIIILLVGLYILLISSLKRSRPAFWFIKRAPLWTLTVLIGINICNFDWLIVHYNRYYGPQDQPVALFMTNVSTDSGALQWLEEELRKLPPSLQRRKALDELEPKIKKLEKKYDNGWDFRSFNFSQYYSWQQLK